MALTPKGQTRGTQLSFPAMGDGLTFMTPPLAQETEITGPSALKLTGLVVHQRRRSFHRIARVLRRTLKEVVFQGAIDPHTPWWRKAGCAPRTASSTRKTVDGRTAPITPHDEETAAGAKGKPVELDIEIWPTSIAVPAGYRVALSIRGKDYEYGGASGGKLSNFKNELKGCGPFLHDDARDRPPAIFNGVTTLHFIRSKAPYLLLPIIPPKKLASAKKRRRK